MIVIVIVTMFYFFVYTCAACAIKGIIILMLAMYTLLTTDCLTPIRMQSLNHRLITTGYSANAPEQRTLRA